MRLDFTPPDHKVRAAWFFRGMAAQVCPPDMAIRIEDQGCRQRLGLWLELIEVARAVEALERASGRRILIPKPGACDPVTFLPPGASTERIPIRGKSAVSGPADSLPAKSAV